MLYIIKRNKERAEFNRDKIKNAIDKCIIDVGNKSQDKFYTSKLISIEIEHNHLDDDYVLIEDIQDEVENLLMKYDLKEEAKSYILYREKRKDVRDKQSRLYEESQKKIEEVMASKNIENSNANVDESSFSGKNSKITSHFLKEYALDNIMDKEVAKAHREGLLYTHDLDSYCDGRHNCLNIDFDDLFNNNKGFNTRNGDVRQPNDIMTFFQLIAVAFQIQSQVQFGGVGSTKIDYEGAKYVSITFKKSFRDALMDRNDYSEEHAKQIIKKLGDKCRLGNKELIEEYPNEYKIAKRHTETKTLQGAESLYHNLNTLESRAGSQVK